MAKGAMQMIISPELSPLKRYTYADYITWNDGIRYELFDGVPYIKFEQEIGGVPSAMAAPAPGHQSIHRELFVQLANFLKGRQCQVFSAPLDVRLDAEADITDDTERVVFQPDIVVICDRSKLDKKGYKGAPDMVIEILSKTTGKKDKILKMQKYQQYGVKEYWIVDPDTRFLYTYLLVNGRYVANNYSDEDIAPVVVLPGCEINLSEVFASLDELEIHNDEEN